LRGSKGNQIWADYIFISMNTKIALPILIVICLLANSLTAEDRPFPYALNKRDFVLLPLGIGLSFLGDSLTGNYDPITLEEISARDRNDIDAFDRPASYNWSFDWEERSDQYHDILVTSSLFMMSVPPLLHTKLSNTLTVATMLL
jgi:hypothetical protein